MAPLTLFVCKNAFCERDLLAITLKMVVYLEKWLPAYKFNNWIAPEGDGLMTAKSEMKQKKAYRDR